MKGVHVFYDGHVQGVGFRYTARYIAKGFEVRGWIRNRLDGRVEMQVCGDDEEVDGFLEAMRTSVLAGHIADEQLNEIDAPTHLRGFHIIG